MGVIKSGMTFCQKSGSFISRSADLESLVNLDLLTTIPCLFNQEAVFAPSTTRVRVLVAKILSISSAQNCSILALSSSSKAYAPLFSSCSISLLVGLSSSSSCPNEPSTACSNPNFLLALSNISCSNVRLVTRR